MPRHGIGEHRNFVLAISRRHNGRTGVGNPIVFLVDDEPEVLASLRAALARRFGGQSAVTVEVFSVISGRNR